MDSVGTRYKTRDELDTALDRIAAAPTDDGALAMVVRRPAVDAREVLDEAMLDTTVGLVGDNWDQRPSRSTADGGPDPDKQLNIMSVRAIAAICDDEARWPLAGDQLFVDLDLRETNLPAGTRLAIGSAIVEITAAPHTGCAKFSERFGPDARRWVNSGDLRLRGICGKVVQNGTIRPGDAVTKV